MCFSATASFTSAGVLGVIGVVSVSRAGCAREFLLAATPLAFALQQFIEGLLWLNLAAAPEGQNSAGLATLFLFFAEAFWPVYAPAAVLAMEPRRERRPVMLACLAAGVGVAAYLLFPILTLPHGAALRDGHIVYFTEARQSNVVALAYLAATALPLVLSSRRTVTLLGVVVLVGSVVAYLLYWEAFVSVWCFFAAAASSVILFYSEQSRRLRVHGAVA